MRVLVYERRSMGHGYHYLHHLLPLPASEVEEVVVAIAAPGRESVEFTSLLAPSSDRIGFDASDPEDDSWARRTWRVRLQALGNLRDAARRICPDYVPAPTADLRTKSMGLFRAAGR